MKKMKKRFPVWLWIIFGFLVLLTGVYFIFTLGRPAPVPVKKEVFDGVTYRRVVQYFPHSMIAHVLVIDTRHTKPQFLITPPDEVEDGVLKARTTSQFLEEYGVQIAINGDGFFPWWSRSPVDYYPHVDDPVTPNGLTASQGEVYADGLQNIKPEPTLYISRRNDLTFNRQPSKIFNAISGDRMLVLSGDIVPDLNDTAIHPRTAIGISKNGRWLYLVVIDGRQPFYSTGATFQELAEILKDFDAFFAMSLDGGGSSAMVIEGEYGNTVVLNSPIDSYIPGRQRPVANHFGIFLEP
ncbi:MAG: phosphodiester glycosidase family protein [Anaerolineales bacterium]|nr:phosphodiester glycosidase family protein [Anaerolineales bacterium]